MGRRVVAKTVPPGQVDADVRTAHLAVDFLVTAEDGHIAKLRPLIHAFKREVRRDDLAAAIQRIFDNVGGDISGGASNDMERATKIANRMITRLGMSEKLGPVVWGSDRDEVFLGYEINSSNGYSEKIAAEIDTEIRQIIEDAYARAKQLLSDNAEKLHFVAEYLVKYEVMTGDQFKAYLERGATEEELNAMVEQKRRKQAEEGAARKEAEEKRRAADELARRRREEREHAMRGGFPRAPQPPSDTQKNADENEDGTNGE